MQDHAADQLYVEMPLAEHPFPPPRGRSRRQAREFDPAWRHWRVRPGKPRCGRAIRRRRSVDDLGFERIDGCDFRTVGLQTAIVGTAENRFREGGEHPKTFLSRPAARRKACRGTRALRPRAKWSIFYPTPRTTQSPWRNTVDVPISERRASSVHGGDRALEEREIRVGVPLVNLAPRQPERLPAATNSTKLRRDRRPEGDIPRVFPRSGASS